MRRRRKGVDDGDHWRSSLSLNRKGRAHGRACGRLSTHGFTVIQWLPLPFSLVGLVAVDQDMSTRCPPSLSGGFGSYQGSRMSIIQGRRYMFVALLAITD